MRRTFARENPFSRLLTTTMLRLLTAGESHGPALVAIVDGFPAGLRIDLPRINSELRRRQGGYGRGGRQSIEADEVQVVSGTWRGETIGSPICLQIVNKDHKLERLQELPRPRPGHGDLAGSLKYLGSIRGVLERASARETAIRVAAGALAAQLLERFQIAALGYVIRIGPLEFPYPDRGLGDWPNLRDQSAVYSLAPAFDDQARELIDDTKAAGDTLGGVIEVRVDGVPPGLGSHAQWDRKLDARLAAAVISIQAIKGVEIGLGFGVAARRGSEVHDPIQFDPARRGESHLGFVRPTNNAGGIEAGISNGQPVIIRAAKKPISTLQKPLDSIDLETKETAKASYERSDICAVPAASVIVQNVVAFEIAAALIDKFGGDSLTEMQQRFQGFLELARKR
jgi:chorismate synthase